MNRLWMPGWLGCALWLAAAGCDANGPGWGPRCQRTCSDAVPCVGGRACVEGVCTGEVDGVVPRVRLPATDGSVPVPDTVTSDGMGSRHVGRVALAQSVGVVTVDGEEMPALAYERTVFPGHVLFQTLAVSRDRWVVLWLYCRNGALSDIYLHSTDGLSVDHESATGSCREGGAADVPVQFPAVDMEVSPLLEGFRVDGRDVVVDAHGRGALRLGTTEFVLLAYNTVDCRFQCGPRGWQELHVLLYDPVSLRACFAILYLYADDDDVQLAYALSLPDLTGPTDTAWLCARWRS